ncbi:CLOCK-interacting pacemaker isoform X1 [Fundulus heteroclitus]|uniref:CLOCK-interacting pacemaker isoform X1 n=1 Tax=Fundulus heteroclitus TaxID=8078 RepID=UPI00165AA4E3|nr:CLOCK-interacting pacemaker isoform X1 [Fundulus heteroclitus]
MPKEQRFLSKNAKDKSNSAAMLAMRDTNDADDRNRRSSRCSSEKDSGFSEGSDWQQTDVEDQRSSQSQLRRTDHAEAPPTGQSKAHSNRDTQNPTMMPTKLAQPLVYIIKQPATTQKRSQPRADSSMRTGSHAVSSHMILLQQPGFLPATLQLRKPLTRTPSVAESKTSSAYFPILNSYPRIAPHPTKKPPDKALSNQDSQNLSKRICTERRPADASATSGGLGQHRHPRPQPTVPNSVPLSSSSSRNVFSISSTNLGPPSISSPHSTSSYPPEGGSRRNVTASTRRRQFLNTVELLRQSGLLDITLRTKELLRQSSATEQDISQLRQHTELLCQAVSNPGHSPHGDAAWEHVFQAMVESGSYPNLKTTHESQNPSHLAPISQTQSISSGNMKIRRPAESSCLFTVGSEQAQVKQDREVETSERSEGKVAFVCPDSSTG